MIGSQKSNALLRNETCSTWCQKGDLRASSYITGRCQPILTEMKADQQKTGCDTNRAILWSTVDERNGLTTSIENCRGNPQRRGRYGAPQRMSGGATINKRRCLIMWTVNSHAANACRSKPPANTIVLSPAKKAAS